jgi:hypothetical protein
MSSGFMISRKVVAGQDIRLIAFDTFPLSNAGLKMGLEAVYN